MPTWKPSDLVNYAKRQPFKSPAKSGYNRAVVVAFFAEHGIYIEPEFEFKFHPYRKWRFDLCFPTRGMSEGVKTGPHGGLAVEVDGGVFVAGAHNRGARMLKTWEKENAAACMGYRILRCQPADLCTKGMVDLIKRCLGL